MLPPRRYVILGLLFACFVTVLWIASLRFESDDGPLRGSALGPVGGGAARTALSSLKKDDDAVDLGPGKAIAEKLGNETAK
jgi:hypothetical protein